MIQPVFKTHFNEKFNWKKLSANPNAILLLEQNMDKVDWLHLSMNPYALHILEKTPERIYLSAISQNYNAISYIEKHPEQIDWVSIFANPNAIHIIENNLKLLYERPIDYIKWEYLSQNENAIHILEKNLEFVDWKNLSANSNAIDILEKNIDKINWNSLCTNPNKRAINLIERFMYKLNEEDLAELNSNPNAMHIIVKRLKTTNLFKKSYAESECWYNLSTNPNAIELLKKYPDKINWTGLSSNPSIMSMIYNYRFMKYRFYSLNKELVKYVNTKYSSPDYILRYKLRNKISFEEAVSQIQKNF